MRNYAALLKDLQDDLRNREIMLTSDMTISDARALWLSRSFFKKFEDISTKDADSAALALFIESNELCRNFHLEPQGLFEDELIGGVRSAFDNIFFSGPDHNVSFSDILEGCACGPGASVGVESPNFFTKLFDSPLTRTSDHLYRLYRYAIADLPMWRDAEKYRKSVHGDELVAGNRLSFVPKSSEISRTICTEPVLNMFFQQGLGSVFRRILKRRFRIDLSYQPTLNRQLAREGSIDGSFGTIDLTSASDSVSLILLKSILPKYIYTWLNDFRSPTVTYPGTGKRDELHMVSSMGNGFTFPLQTLLFSVIVTTCYHILGIKPEYGTRGPLNFAVFGDDIIVRKDSYAFVTRALELFGFRVNEDKSFNSGSFRESCGGDFYRGYPIRGVYIRSLKTSADVYSAINRLIRWSAESGVLLTRVIARLRTWVDFLPVPFHAGDAEGVKTPYPAYFQGRDGPTQSVVYYALEKIATSFKVPTDEMKVRYYPRRFKKRLVISSNFDGLIASFIGGFIRNERISVKSHRERLKIRRRITSSWRGVAAVDTCREREWIITFELLFPMEDSPL